ncbi:OmpH family outer membrane protein [Desulforhopalus sp. IMCC35007]|uniref:OmpH family outer membrane protein n=1 Tax=Desulforhopalus sp. IMCC35007 TaxID=2569543 RepID=UPI0010AE0206|nr:OmpH family outer membrane protein [Desulforhopalus sp. IMCC35007]TKB06725.1 OmpH family outer membrane protein [Desulforhopalus sp. IMCC35007]
MIRKFIQIAMIATLVLMGAHGSMAADLKLGVMNVQKIIVECKAGKAAKERFDVKMKGLQSSFKEEEADLKNLQEEIKKKSSAWSEEKKAEKVREFQKNGRELQAKTEDARFEMKQLQDKELEPILKSLEQVVEKYGKDQGYMMILDSKNGVIYFDKAVDITETIVKLLDKAMSAQ